MYPPPFHGGASAKNNGEANELTLGWSQALGGYRVNVESYCYRESSRQLVVRSFAAGRSIRGWRLRRDTHVENMVLRLYSPTPRAPPPPGGKGSLPGAGFGQRYPRHDVVKAFPLGYHH